MSDQLNRYLDIERNQSNMGRGEKVLLFAQSYIGRWQNRSNIFWIYKLVCEMLELIGSLMGVHKHPPELELTQVASIAINMLRKLDKDTEPWPKDIPEDEPVFHVKDSAPTDTDAVVPELLKFAQHMQKEINANAERKGNWKEWEIDWFDWESEVVHHLDKIHAAFGVRNHGGVMEYAADLANYCLFIAHNSGAMAALEDTEGAK